MCGWEIRIDEMHLALADTRETRTLLEASGAAQTEYHSRNVDPWGAPQAETERAQTSTRTNARKDITSLERLVADLSLSVPMVLLVCLFYPVCLASATRVLIHTAQTDPLSRYCGHHPLLGRSPVPSPLQIETRQVGHGRNFGMISSSGRVC